MRIGEPTEAALIVLAEKLGCPDDALNSRCLQKEWRAPRDAMAFSNYWQRNVKRQALLEFSRDRKSMGVLAQEGSGKNQLFCKGAPENIVERCTHVMAPNGKVEKMSPVMKKSILASVE